jgi:RNA polymerase sigma-70 factor (ECF subfamily)
MFHIARNAQIDFLKKQSKETCVDDDALDTASEDAQPEELLEQHQNHLLLMQALDKLPHEKREVLILSRFHDMKYEDIAALMHCQVGTIKARVHRALAELRTNFNDISGENG